MPHRRPEDLQLAAVGHGQAEQEAQERGLARTVGSHEAVDLARGDVEVDSVEGDDVPEGLGDTARTDGSGRWHVGFLHPADRAEQGPLPPSSSPDEEVRGPGWPDPFGLPNGRRTEATTPGVI